MIKECSVVILLEYLIILYFVLQVPVHFWTSLGVGVTLEDLACEYNYLLRKVLEFLTYKFFQHVFLDALC